MDVNYVLELNCCSLWLSQRHLLFTFYEQRGGVVVERGKYLENFFEPSERTNNVKQIDRTVSRRVRMRIHVRHFGLSYIY
jgi:hypothetical protein